MVKGQWVTRAWSIGLLFACGLSASATEPDTLELIAELSGILFQREAQVTSFSADYTLRQMNIDPDSGTWKDMKARLVFRDPDVRLDEWKPSGGRRIKGRLGGIRTEFSISKEEGPVGARIEQDASPVPVRYQGSQVSIGPRMALFGLIHGETLKNRFTTGSLAATVMDDGCRRLTWYAPPGARPHRIDFLLDAKQRLTQIDFGLGATVAKNPAIADLIREFGEDKFFRLEWSLTMSEFKDVDGVPVPLLARRTYWKQNGSSGAAALKRFEETGRIKKSRTQTGSSIEKIQNSIHSSQTGLPKDGLTPMERQRRIDVISMFQSEPPTAMNMQEMRIDPDSVAINPPVSDETFWIDIPEGTRIVGNAALLRMPVSPPETDASEAEKPDDSTPE